MIKTEKTIKLSWNQVTELIEIGIRYITGRSANCTLVGVGNTDWQTKVLRGLHIKQYKEICDYLHINCPAPEHERHPECPYVEYLPYGLSVALLRFQVGYTWETTMMEGGVLWLLGCKKIETIKIDDESINTGVLVSIKDIVNYFKTEDAIYTNLLKCLDAMYDREEMKKCWHIQCHHSGNLGAFLLPVREGIMYLPYNSVVNVHNGPELIIQGGHLIDENDFMLLKMAYEHSVKSTGAVLSGIEEYFDSCDEKHDLHRAESLLKAALRVIDDNCDDYSSKIDAIRSIGLTEDELNQYGYESLACFASDNRREAEE